MKEPLIVPDSVKNYAHLSEPFRSKWIQCFVCKQVPTETVYRVEIPALGVSTSCCSEACAQQWIESELANDGYTQGEENYDDPTLPTQATRPGWIHARRKHGDYPEDTQFSGKWLIWLSAQAIDRYWQAIKAACEQGRLGGEVKVSKAGNRSQKQGKPFVICVYTYDWSDIIDVMGIRQALRDLGIKRSIPYKADEDTLRLRYGSNYTPIYRA